METEVGPTTESVKWRGSWKLVRKREKQKGAEKDKWETETKVAKEQAEAEMLRRGWERERERDGLPVELEDPQFQDRGMGLHFFFPKSDSPLLKKRYGFNFIKMQKSPQPSPSALILIQFRRGPFEFNSVPTAETSASLKAL